MCQKLMQMYILEQQLQVQQSVFCTGHGVALDGNGGPRRPLGRAALTGGAAVPDCGF